MSIEAIVRTVYRSPAAGRSYLTARAAFAAEARAVIRAKYPDEATEYDQGHVTYPGSTWRDLPRSDVLYRRMSRLVRTAFENKQKGAAA